MMKTILLFPPTDFNGDETVKILPVSINSNKGIIILTIN